MATVTGLTAARMLAIEAASVVDGDVVGNDLILTKHDGSTINAGAVVGPQGPTGPAGSDTVVLSAQAVLEVGVLNHIRAGRLLTPADFTNMGLSAPVGLYPLSGTPDTSGNGRNLTNKGSVPFTAKGIAGAANSAALFAGNAAQALYITDTGASDPFRLKTGSMGCWFRVAKQGVVQALMGKYNSSDGQHAWWLQVTAANVIELTATLAGTVATQVQSLSFTPITDDRWHMAVGVIDGGTMKVYIDGMLEGNALFNGVAFGGSAPFNIGGLTANAGTNAINPFYGRIDEAFVTADVLSEDQIRNLYCARVTHSLGSIPKRANLSVRRRRRGAALVSGDFPTQPLRLYNFTAGALTDAGSNGTSLTAGGTPQDVAGPDGSAGNAKRLDGITGMFGSTDTGLPSGTNPRSYGCWFKQEVTSGTPALISWGNGASTSNQALWVTGGGQIVSRSPASDDMTGPYINDRKWHFAVVTEENAPVDGNKRKLYVDGKFVAASGTLNAITLGGANKFRIGAWPDGAGPFNGYIDAVFICNYVLQADEIQTLFLKASQPMGPSPKNAGDHIEVMSATDLLVDFSALEQQHQIDLVVA